MSWVYLDDKFHSNQKVLEVGNDGAGLFCRALSYCGDHLTDGFVPLVWARTAGSAKLRTRLLEAGMWVEVCANDWYEIVAKDDTYKIEIPSSGYFIPDYLMLNPSKARVLDKREKRAAAGRLGAAAKHGKTGDTVLANATADALANASSFAGDSYTPPTPAPSPKDSNPPYPPFDEVQGGNVENGGTDFGILKRLLALVPKDGRDTARNKVIRTVKANRSSEADLVAAIEAAAGSNVRDPLAVILAELKKRAAARKAA